MVEEATFDAVMMPASSTTVAAVASKNNLSEFGTLQASDVYGVEESAKFFNVGVDQNVAN